MKRLTMCAVLLLCSTVHAAPSPTESEAVSFGYQAGSVAGAAQACGQDVSLLSNRTAEAISLLAQNDSDRSRALGAYQQSMHDAASAQAASQRIACSQVLTDYSGLPILKDDYRQTVLSQLAPAGAGTPNAANPSPSSAPRPNVPVPAGMPSTPNPQAQAGTPAGAEAQQVAAALTLQPGQALPAGVGQSSNNSNPVLRDNPVLRPTYGAPTNPVLQNNPLIESNNVAPPNPALHNNPAFQNNFAPPQTGIPSATPSVAAPPAPSY